MDRAFVKRRFLEVVKHHKVTILNDNGVHRCIRFARPGTINYSFTLTTWPGHLAISGDLDDFVFTRLHDMFEFFEGRHGEINPGYWGEKVTAVCKGGEMKTYSEDAYIAAIRRDMASYLNGFSLSDAKAIVQGAKDDWLFDYPESHESAVSCAMAWRCPVTGQHPFYDFYEHDLTEYCFGFLFSLHAIEWGIRKYRQIKEGRTQADHDRLILAGAL